MRTMLPDGRIEGAQSTRTFVRAAPSLPPRPVEKPGDETVIWRDGTVTRRTAAGRIIALAPVAPLPDEMNTQPETNTRGRSGGFTLIETIIVLVIAALLLAMAIPAYHTVKEGYSEDTYRAWCKLHKRQDISFAEWKAARRAGLLNVSPANPNTEDAR